MPEWHQYTVTLPSKGDSAWYAQYRNVYSGCPHFAGQALVMYFMNGKALWNHNAFFDYTDRYVGISTTGTDPFGYTVQGQAAGYGPSGMELAMWTSYRSTYGSIETPSCGPEHLSLCSTELDCTTAGGNYCSGICQSAECYVENIISSSLRVIGGVLRKVNDHLVGVE